MLVIYYFLLLIIYEKRFHFYLLLKIYKRQWYFKRKLTNLLPFTNFPVAKSKRKEKINPLSSPDHNIRPFESKVMVKTRPAAFPVPPCHKNIDRTLQLFCIIFKTYCINLNISFEIYTL